MTTSETAAHYERDAAPCPEHRGLVVVPMDRVIGCGGIGCTA